ncbi:MAG: hypothetical protein P0S96_05405 [Simkaniaceae bacterium]|nr:hypothetical protein [Candidatus Sacchlamyda saccharinae]
MLKKVFGMFFIAIFSGFLMGSNAMQNELPQSNSGENYLEKSLEVANLIENKEKKSEILTVIAIRLAKCTQNFDKSIEIARSIPNKEKASLALSNVAYIAAEKGQLKKALETVLMMTSSREKYYTLCDISSLLKDEEAKEKFDNMIVEYVLNDLRKDSDLSSIDYYIELLAHEFLTKKNYKVVLRLSEMFYNQSKKNNLLCSVANDYASHGDFEKALELAMAIQDKESRETSFEYISEEYILQLKEEEMSSIMENEELEFTQFSELAFKRDLN